MRRNLTNILLLLIFAVLALQLTRLPPLELRKASFLQGRLMTDSEIRNLETVLLKIADDVHEIEDNTCKLLDGYCEETKLTEGK